MRLPTAERLVFFARRPRPALALEFEIGRQQMTMLRQLVLRLFHLRVANRVEQAHEKALALFRRLCAGNRGSGNACTAECNCNHFVSPSRKRKIKRPARYSSLTIALQYSLSRNCEHTVTLHRSPENTG